MLGPKKGEKKKKRSQRKRWIFLSAWKAGTLGEKGTPPGPVSQKKKKMDREGRAVFPRFPKSLT